MCNEPHRQRYFWYLDHPPYPPHKSWKIELNVKYWKVFVRNLTSSPENDVSPRHTYKLGKHTYMLGEHTYMCNIHTRCKKAYRNIDTRNRFDPCMSESLNSPRERRAWGLQTCIHVWVLCQKMKQTWNTERFPQWIWHIHTWVFTHRDSHGRKTRPCPLCLKPLEKASSFGHMFCSM